MLKKTVTVMMLTLGITSFSQHHLKGSKFIEVGGGITKYGFFGDANFDMQIKPKLYVKSGLLAEFGNLKSSNTKYQSYMLNVGSFYNLFNLNHKLYVNGGGGAVVKLDNVDAFDGAIQSNSKNYGAYLGAETELFVSDKVAIGINAYQNFYLGKEKSVLSESKAFFVGLGLKFSL
jgi:hypothetical protein